MIALILCLRAARSVLGWSQTELASRAGISKPALNRLERFESEPRLETVLKIEEALSAAGVVLERQSDGKSSIILQPEVIEEMSERIKAGESVTSRGKVGGVKEVRTRFISREQMDKLNKKQ
jgi:transcriptional regulator with XRE-family HTH domain